MKFRSHFAKCKLPLSYLAMEARLQFDASFAFLRLHVTSSCIRENANNAPSGLRFAYVEKRSAINKQQ